MYHISLREREREREREKREREREGERVVMSHIPTDGAAAWHLVP